MRGQAFLLSTPQNGFEPPLFAEKDSVNKTIIQGIDRGEMKGA